MGVGERSYFGLNLDERMGTGRFIHRGWVVVV